MVDKCREGGTQLWALGNPISRTSFRSAISAESRRNVGQLDSYSWGNTVRVMKENGPATALSFCLFLCA